MVKRFGICSAFLCIFLGCYCDLSASRGNLSNRHRRVSINQNEQQKVSEKRNSILRRMSNLAIDIVTPASGVLSDFYLNNKKDFAKFGIKVPSEALINKQIHFFADTDENRLSRLVRAIDNPKSDIIWTMRGGFGSYKLISSLKNMPKPAKSKFFIGYSDITALNLFISQNWEKYTVIHAPVFREISPNEFYFENWSLLLGILEGKIKNYQISGLRPFNSASIRCTTDKIKGRLTGGNLSMIESSLGTCWEIQTQGKILFIEDYGESGPSLYRSLYHLKETGKLDGTVAIIFGRFSRCAASAENLKAFADELDIPVFITDKFGHGGYNTPIVYNASGVIEKNTLQIDLSEL